MVGWLVGWLCGWLGGWLLKKSGYWGRAEAVCVARQPSRRVLEKKYHEQRNAQEEAMLRPKSRLARVVRDGLQCVSPCATQQGHRERERVALRRTGKRTKGACGRTRDGPPLQPSVSQKHMCPWLLDSSMQTWSTMKRLICSFEVHVLQMFSVAAGQFRVS